MQATTHTATRPNTSRNDLLSKINGEWHERSLWAFMVVVMGHWAEHIIQGVQIWVMNVPRASALGGLGYLAPVLVSSEALHFGFAISMFAGLVILRPGFCGQSRKWWDISLALQGWHFIEHALLFGQVVIGANMFGSPVPTSLLQPFIPRAELHLMYNLVVFIPMVVAMWLHTRPSANELNACSCAVPLDGGMHMPVPEGSSA